MWYLKENNGSMHYSYHFLQELLEQQQQLLQAVVMQQVSARASMIFEAWQLIRHQRLLNDEAFWKACMEHCEELRRRKHNHLTAVALGCIPEPRQPRSMLLSHSSKALDSSLIVASPTAIIMASLSS
jgi:hypothetical protein